MTEGSVAKFKSLFERSGLTRKELPEIVGKSIHTIDSWFAGRRTPGEEAVRKLAEYVEQKVGAAVDEAPEAGPDAISVAEVAQVSTEAVTGTDDAPGPAPKRIRTKAIRREARKAALTQGREIRNQEIEAVRQRIFERELARLRRKIQKDVAVSLKGEDGKALEASARAAAAQEHRREAEEALLADIVRKQAKSAHPAVLELRKAVNAVIDIEIRMSAKPGDLGLVDAYVDATRRLRDVAARRN